MNNDQFRRLVLASSEKPPGARKGSPPPASGRGGGPGTGSLGSRERASIPMTPRSVAGAQGGLARQMTRQTGAAPPKKDFKVSVPKGVKLATGYTDRARERPEESADDRKERLTALEKALRKGDVDRETYDKLRFEVAGGSLETTHLVKGLDFKLLERIRRGEDVYGNGKNGGDKEDETGQEDVDAFDELERREVSAIDKAKREKKTGQLAAFPAALGQKRSRDQILAELKASREAAKSQQASSLGSKFKRIGTKEKAKTRIERDSKGREVLIIVDENGCERRKVRKLRAGEEEEGGGAGSELLQPDPKAKPLGMEVPEKYRQRAEPEEEVDDDIFGGVGDDYNPLAGMDASDSDSGSDSGSPRSDGQQPTGRAATEAGGPGAERATSPAKSVQPRNYFQDAKTGLLSAKPALKPALDDAAMLAAIKRAAAVARRGGGDGGDYERAAALEERRRRLVRMSERDDADVDAGFGTSRLEDEEDSGTEQQRGKLSVWGGGGGGGGGEGSGGARTRGGQAKRKRGPKKRKGDANSAADVLRAVERQRGGP